MKQKSPPYTHAYHKTTTWSLFCIGQLLLGVGPALEYNWYAYPVAIQWRKPIFPFPASVSFKELLGWGWDYVTTSPTQCWVLFSVNPCRSWVFCHSLCEFKYVTRPVLSGRYCFLAVIHHFCLLQFFCLPFSWVLRGSLIKTLRTWVFLSLSLPT